MSLLSVMSEQRVGMNPKQLVGPTLRVWSPVLPAGTQLLARATAKSNSFPCRLLQATPILFTCYESFQHVFHSLIKLW